MMVIMALVTTFATTPLLERIYPLDELARDLLVPEVLEPSTVVPHAYTVLACVSYSHSGPGLVTVGAGLAGPQSGLGKIYALHLSRPGERASFLRDSFDGSDHAAFAPLIERANALAVDVNPLSFVSLQPAREICDVAEVKQADLVLLGWHKPLLGKGMLGGTVHDVMKKAAADVAVLVDRGVAQLKRLLVPYLGSDHDRAALRTAQRLAEHAGAEVTILHVVDEVRDQERLGVEDRIREVFHREPGAGPGKDGFGVTLKVVSGSPVDVVLAEAILGYDLLVIGVGREWGLESRLFGLQPEAILKRSPISVLAVRAGRQAARESRDQQARPSTQGASVAAAALLPP